MEKLVLFIVLILSIKINAQDPQLIENTWYLENVILNGQNYIPPPPNEEVPFVYMNFLISSFSTAGCDELSGEIEYGISESTFSFPSILNQTFLDCNNEDNNLFDDIYFSFFYDSQTENFNYSISTGGNESKTLIITSSSGDEAHYNSVLLSREDNEQMNFVLTPNPADSNLSIITSDIIQNANVKIFNINGKLISQTYHNNSSYFTINISELEIGVYFLSIDNDNRKQRIKKFVKK